MKDPIVDGGERLKVLDFGIAKLSQGAGSIATQAGSVFGTPPYMSPEQCTSAGTVDLRSDLYAVGCILHEAATGRPPFGHGGLELIASHMRDVPPDVRTTMPGLPADFALLIARLLEKDPARRPQTARELAPDMSTSEMAAATSPTTAATSVAPVARRSNLGMTLAIGGVVAAAVTGVIVLVLTRGGGDAAIDAGAGTAAARAGGLDENAILGGGGGNPSDGIAAAPKPADPNLPIDKIVFSVPISGNPTRGHPEALVTIVRGSEYMCPFCERSRPTFEKALTEYPNDVRIVHKHFAHIHAEGPALAAAACAAQKQGKFWQMDALLWEAFTQRKVAPDHIEGLARGLGLDMAMYRSDVTDFCPAEVDADERILKDLGVTGVPVYFINGRMISGAQPWDSFKALIDEELRLARARVASGATSPARYYQDWVVATGVSQYKKPPPPAAGRRRAQPDPALVYGIPVVDDPFRGKADALVTIVRGGEYACPYCEKVRPTLDQILRDYPDDVRVVYKDFVVHPTTATEPAKAACAAHRQGKFWKMDEAIWEKAFKARTFDAAHLEGLARDVGLDVRRYRADLPSCADEVQADMAVLTRFGIGATPTFFINGRFLSGAQPYPAFKALIDEELTKARQRVRQGTPASAYYSEWVIGRGLDNFTPPPPLAEAPTP